MVFVPRVTPRSATFVQQRGQSSDLGGSAAAQAAVGVGQAVDRAADTVNQFAIASQQEELKRKKQDIERQAGELEVSWLQAKRQKLHAQDGFYTTNGSTTLQASETIEDDLRALHEEIAGGAQDPLVAQVFKEKTRLGLETELTNAVKYTEKQRVNANNATNDALLEEAIEEYGISGGDAAILEQSKATIFQAINEQAEQNGWEGEVTQRKLQETYSEMHKQAIMLKLAEGEDLEAEQMLEDAIDAGEIDSTLAATVKKAIEETSILGTAQKSSDAIIEQHGGDEKAALAAAREIEDPRVREETVRNVKTQLAEIKSRQKEQEKETYTDAFQAINTGQSIDSWAKENPERYLMLAGDGEAMARLRRSELAQASRQTYSLVSDGITLAGLQEMTDEDLATLRTKEWQHDLTKEEYSSLLTMRKAAINRLNEDEATDPKLKADFDKMFSTIKSMAPHLNLGKEDQDPTANAVLNRANTWLQEQTDAGVEVSSADMQGKVLELTETALVPQKRAPFGFELPPFAEGILNSVIGEPEELEILATELSTMSEEEILESRFPIENLKPQTIQAVRGVFSSIGIPNPSDEAIEEYFKADVLQSDELELHVISQVQAGEI